MEIICSLTFIILLQMVPPWVIILNDINRAYSGEKLEVEEYTSYDLALDNRMLWQVMLIRMQRTTINPFLKCGRKHQLLSRQERSSSNRRDVSS